MSLFEIIGKWISPGPIGTISRHPRGGDLPATWIVVSRAAISIAGLTIMLVFLANGLGSTLACLAYVLMGTVLRPEPDYSNIGWLGGLIDDPFRISDDVNRFLILLLVVLWPGRLVGSGFVLLGRWLIASSAATR